MSVSLAEGKGKLSINGYRYKVEHFFSSISAVTVMSVAFRFSQCHHCEGEADHSEDETYDARNASNDIQDINHAFLSFLLF